jgi:hypothetical protein
VDRNKFGRGWVAGGVVAALVASLVAVVGVASAAQRAGSPPVNGGLPAISGTVRQGATLTASPGVWGGTVPISYTYQWQQCDSHGTGCSSIAGATTTTFALTSTQVGKTIRVLVGATNSAGSAQAYSQPTAKVAQLGNAPANTAQPDPSGIAQEGQKITVNNGSWAGTTPISFSYQWQRCRPNTSTCPFISGATHHGYLLVSADVGFRMRAEVTAKNSIGTSAAFSNLTDTVVAKGNPPVNTQLPVVAGDPTVGNTVSGYPGSWSGAQTYSYAWLRCNAGGGGCAAIPGATSSTYTISSADAKLTIRFKATASNSSGSTSANSIAIPVISQPSGSGNSVPVSSLTPRPDHLLISAVTFSPSPFANPGGTFTIRVKVTLEGTNKVVSGALVYVTPLPYSWAPASAEVPTGIDGWVAITIHTTKNLPHSGALVMQVRARGPGNSEQDILGGISTRRLVQLSLR